MSRWLRRQRGEVGRQTAQITGAKKTQPPTELLFRCYVDAVVETHPFD